MPGVTVNTPVCAARPPGGILVNPDLSQMKGIMHSNLTSWATAGLCRTIPFEGRAAKQIKVSRQQGDSTQPV